MAFGGGKHTVTLDDVMSRVTECDILGHYLGVTCLPVVISSPLRKDVHPSFRLYVTDKGNVHYFDYATRDCGGLFDLLMLMWNRSFPDVLSRIWSDIPSFSRAKVMISSYSAMPDVHSGKGDVKIECRVREWRDYDIEYWGSFGISREWLEYVEIYPVSHKIVTKNGRRYVFGADKYAYAYVERKENRVTVKIYQPFNTRGYKWSSGHDGSVISLWTKIPERGDIVCICSSMKDALCLWANTGIPSIAMQGEGYLISNTAAGELRRRYSNVFILFDNDPPGLADGARLSELTGFTNIVLPRINGAKDVSDLFKSLHEPDRFRDIIIPLFKNNINNSEPF